MTRLARAFLAVAPPEPVLDAIEARLRPIRTGEPPLRWLPRHQWHVTVQFLGAVPDDNALTSALLDTVTRLAPIEVRLAGLGAFPALDRATVAWIGLEDPTVLDALAATVHATTTALGYTPEGRRYHPHLTVGRLAQPRSLTRRFDAFDAAPVGPSWTAGELALIESDTRPDGAVHRVTARMPFDA